jgi:actin-like ATPase involved in cell morphogenesis
VSYQLGVDLGTTYTAAAVSRDGRAEVATLGASGPVMPSVVLLRADGEVLEGDVAVRRGLAEPTRVAREFKRRLGDPTPLVLGGTPYGAESLMSHLLRAVVKLVSDREGEAPERVVLTHPANYGPYKLDMMREVARLAGLDLAKVSFLTEPQAAAISYASRNRVEAGQIVAVYDFGGGTFDAALVQRTEQGFALIGRPEGMDRFGGIDIDAAIVAHVDQVLNGAISAMDPDDPGVQAGVARLRDDCRAAKEALSGDTDTAISVSLPNLQTEVHLTRTDLEEMIRPRLRETIDALNRAVASAGVKMDQVSRILLVGGSSRIPLVADAILRETGRPVAVDAHPKFAIALGAAALGQGTQFAATVPPSARPVAAAAPPAPPAGPTPAPPPPPAVQRPVAPPAPAAPQQTAAAPPRRGNDRTKLVIGAAVAAALVAVIAFVVFRSDGSSSSSTTQESFDTRAPRTDPVETPIASTLPPTVAPTVAPATVAPTAAPTTAAPTTLAGPIITGDQLRSALLTLGDLTPEFVAGTIIDNGNEFCGQLPVHQPITDQTVAFNRFVGTPQEQDLLNDVSVYASVAEATAVFEQQIGLIQNCTQATEKISGITFDLALVGSRFTDAEMKLFPAQCTQGAAAILKLSNTPQNISFTIQIEFVRCANVTTAIDVQFGPGGDANSATTILSSASVASVNKVIKLPLLS